MPSAVPAASTLTAERPRLVPSRPICCLRCISCFSMRVAVAGKMAGKARKSPAMEGP